MADGQLFKPEKDYTKEADKQIPEAEQLAKDNVQAALEKLSALEKHTRQVKGPSDMPSVFLTDPDEIRRPTLLQHQDYWSP